MSTTDVPLFWFLDPAFLAFGLFILSCWGLYCVVTRVYHWCLWQWESWRGTTPDYDAVDPGEAALMEEVALEQERVYKEVEDVGFKVNRETGNLTIPGQGAR